jgi:hypothetical protein
MAESRDKDASISTRRGINERSSTRSDEIYAIRVNGGFPRKVDEYTEARKNRRGGELDEPAAEVPEVRASIEKERTGWWIKRNGSRANACAAL